LTFFTDLVIRARVSLFDIVSISKKHGAKIYLRDAPPQIGGTFETF